jgi:carbamoyl-phosphate synthase large subunit
MNKNRAILVLEDGSVYTGTAFGAKTEAVFELVFNTSMTGYQEIITDPSYLGQAVLFTVSHIGNVGINLEDDESLKPQVSGIVVRSLSPVVSNWRSHMDLSSWLAEHGIPGISGVDTRALTRKLREKGTMRAALKTDSVANSRTETDTYAEVERLLRMAREWPGLDGRDMVMEVTCDEAYHWVDDEGSKWVNSKLVIGNFEDAQLPITNYHIVAYDFGIKENILRHLSALGANVTVVPANTSAEEVLALKPDGVFLSNGPGDPAGLPYASEAVRKLIESETPIFGICLGHQLIGRALGGETARLKFGHHGGNHPVQDLRSKQVYVTAQNHNYMVVPESLDPDEVEVTYLSLNDGSLEGIRLKNKPVYSVQFHPEAAPGPHDAHEIFAPFFEAMAERKQGNRQSSTCLPVSLSNSTPLTILIPGSGPIVIGQAAEFDYSGTQAVKALRKLGHRIVLVNSNPATIMTDPDIADATYIEPLTPEALEAIIEKEKPDVMLPTVGAQTGLNLAMILSERGVLAKHNVKLIGASLTAIKAAEDRLLFRETMKQHGLPIPEGGPAYNYREAQEIAKVAGYPLLVRASFAMGGTGASWVYQPSELEEAVRKGIQASPIGQAWIEQSILGWKEYELEVMRDSADNFVVVCSIENLDPMGIHTGDSITVAPAQTLTDREYQVMRSLARSVMSAVGVETGGANVQFAVNPVNGQIVIIEMNPRVSRSSALASKATGFPIAKIAALVAAGYTLDQITNDITGVTRAAFEPSIDYVVVKIPRWAFEKFPGVEPTLGPQMKSVGEVLALGRTFPEALHKAVQSLEIGVDALDGSGPKREPISYTLDELSEPRAERLFKVYRAIEDGVVLEEIAERSGYDLWFLAQMIEISNWRLVIGDCKTEDEFKHALLKAKQMGFADSYLSRLLFHQKLPLTNYQLPTANIRELRKKLGIQPTFLRVDTCAAEFEAHTPYMYSSYESEDEARPTDREKILILGGGPNRIGQGIEFDYCCCQAAFALKDLGYETIMLNCNPETVSTDYDTADRLYFEPLTLEHVLNVVEREQVAGVIVQFGGQTPLNLAESLKAAGVPIIGTSPESIALAEDREKFAALLRELEIEQPENGIAFNLKDARTVAARIGYPVLVRPSFVLGGRAMAIVGDESQLEAIALDAMQAAEGQAILIDRFMEDAYEVDVDALCDGENVVIGAVMQHIEEAGVHSGDSACVLPPYKVSMYYLGIMRDYVTQLGKALDVRGLMNVQFALKDDVVYVLEVNPRASRTIPYASKATGLPLARVAAQVMAGQTLTALGVTQEPRVDGFFVKEAVLPFNKLPGADARLGPEMRSTGEVMGHASHFGHAFAKSQQAAGTALPLEGAALISVNDFDKGAALKIARDLFRMEFKIYATPGTADFFNKAGVPAEAINQMHIGSPHTVDLIRSGAVNLIINTPLGTKSHADGAEIRSAAVRMNITLLTTLSAASAAVAGIKALRAKELQYRSLQEHYAAQK